MDKLKSFKHLLAFPAKLTYILPAIYMFKLNYELFIKYVQDGIVYCAGFCHSKIQQNDHIN